MRVPPRPVCRRTRPSASCWPRSSPRCSSPRPSNWARWRCSCARPRPTTSAAWPGTWTAAGWRSRPPSAHSAWRELDAAVHGDAHRGLARLDRLGLLASAGAHRSGTVHRLLQTTRLGPAHRHLAQAVAAEAELLRVRLGARLEAADGRSGHLGLDLLARLARQAEAHPRHGQPGQAARQLADGRRVAALDHQFGPTLPAVDGIAARRLGRIARVEREGTGAQLQQARPHRLARFGQGRIQRLAQLALHGSSLAAFAGDRQRDRQQVLRHLAAGLGAEADHVLRLRLQYGHRRRCLDNAGQQHGRHQGPALGQAGEANGMHGGPSRQERRPATRAIRPARPNVYSAPRPSVVDSPARAWCAERVVTDGQIGAFAPKQALHNAVVTNLEPRMTAQANARADRMVVADDDARIRDLLRRYLTQEGFEVLLAEDGKSLNRLLTRENIDLIVLDLMMPGEDGLSICRRLRAANDTTPIIMLTAKVEDVDRIVGLEVGADDYLPKPFNPRELG